MICISFIFVISILKTAKKFYKGNLLCISKLHRLKFKCKIEPSGQLLNSEENVLHSYDIAELLLRLYLK